MKIDEIWPVLSISPRAKNEGGGGGCQGGFAYIYNILLRDPSKVVLGPACGHVNQKTTR